MITIRFNPNAYRRELYVQQLDRLGDDYEQHLTELNRVLEPMEYVRLTIEHQVIVVQRNQGWPYEHSFARLQQLHRLAASRLFP